MKISLYSERNNEIIPNYTFIIKPFSKRNVLALFFKPIKIKSMSNINILVYT